MDEMKDGFIDARFIDASLTKICEGCGQPIIYCPPCDAYHHADSFEAEHLDFDDDDEPECECQLCQLLKLPSVETQTIGDYHASKICLTDFPDSIGPEW